MSTIATGASLSMTGLTMEVTDMEMALSRVAVPTSHMGTTGGHDFKPGKLYSSTLNVSGHYDTADIPIDADPGSITVTVEGGTTWVFNGFIVDASLGLPLETTRSINVTIQVTGSNTAVG